MAIAARSASASRTNARPLSYGTLSHLCASVAHESAQLDAVGEVARDGAAARPQAERAVDVHPGAAPRARARAIVGQRIERAGVHVARLHADDGRAA